MNNPSPQTTHNAFLHNPSPHTPTAINVLSNTDSIVAWSACSKETGGAVGDDDDDGNADEASYDANVGASTDEELLVSCSIQHNFSLYFYYF